MEFEIFLGVRVGFRRKGHKKVLTLKYYSRIPRTRFGISSHLRWFGISSWLAYGSKRLVSYNVHTHHIPGDWEVYQLCLGPSWELVFFPKLSLRLPED